MQPDTPRELKEKDACTRCQFLPTKVKDDLSQKARDLAEKVLSLFERKRAGFGKTEAEMSAVSIECLIRLETIIAAYELQLKRKPAEILKAAFGVREG